MPTLTDQQLQQIVQQNVDAVAGQVALANRANLAAVELCYLPREEALSVVDALLRHDHKYWTESDALLDQQVPADHARSIRAIVAAELTLSGELPSDRVVLRDLPTEHRARFAYAAIAGSCARVATLVFSAVQQYFAILGEDLSKPGAADDETFRVVQGFHSPEYRGFCRDFAVRMQRVVQEAQPMVQVARDMPRA